MQEPLDSEYLTVSEAATNLYEKISNYYNLQIEAIGPEEYEVIKEACNYPEDYETHIKNLSDTMKPENETRQHIVEFLQTYPEFCHPQYTEILDYAIKVIETQPEKAKQAGMQALMQVQSSLEETHGCEVPEQSVSNIPEMIPFQVGAKTIEVPSHKDPLLVSLYSVCFLAYASRMAYSQASNGSCGSVAY